MARAPLDINVVIALLDQGHMLHRAASSDAFWPEPISLLQEGLICWERLLGPPQITDAYLRALAAIHGGRFVTFDRRVGVEVVPAASSANLSIIATD